jgi:uncharacterized protein YbbK (DUF523 family)
MSARMVTGMMRAAMTRGKDVDPSSVRVGISSCLVGAKVRWDGGDKLAPLLVEVLGARVRLVEVCPEMEIGLGAPREPIHLVRIGARTHLVGNASGVEHTAAMERFCDEKLRELERLGLAGYVLKARSPSCGLGSVALFGERGELLDDHASGLFAAALVRAMPGLPVEEEARLGDRAACEAFVERVYAYHRRARDRV